MTRVNTCHKNEPPRKFGFLTKLTPLLLILGLALDYTSRWSAEGTGSLVMSGVRAEAEEAEVGNGEEEDDEVPAYLRERPKFNWSNHKFASS